MERKRINRLKVVLAEKGMTNKQLSEILDKDPAKNFKRLNKYFVDSQTILSNLQTNKSYLTGNKRYM